jgi:hypothetical protein
MKLINVFFLMMFICLGVAKGQPVYRWENWQGNMLLSDGIYRSSPNERSFGLHLWNDRAFGMELHTRESSTGTAIFTRSNSEPIWFGNYDANVTEQRFFKPKMTLVDGKLGIGTTTPLAPLAVMCSGAGIADFRSSNAGNTQIVISNAFGSIGVGIGAITKHGYLYGNTGNVFFGADGAPTMSIIGMNNGNVGIGTEDTKGYKLAVNGNAICEKLVVKSKANWPDYVFNADYKLPSLTELEQYIYQYRHLPDVPSADDVAKDGLSVGENQAALLKKIEELTLYVIELNKKLEEQQKELNAVKQQQPGTLIK